MGCGKSKHAVETATTITKSTNSDGTKQTTTATATKTVKETTTGSSLIQKEADTKSLRVEDTDKKPVNNVDKTDNEKVEKPAEGLKDVKVKDSDPAENAAPTSAENAGKAEEVVRGEEKVNGLGQADANNVSNVVPTSSKDDVATTEVVKEDEGKREPTLKADNNAKTANVVPIEENKMKESNLTKDNLTKTEFLTPTLSEDVVGPFEVTKGDGEIKDSKKETIPATSDEKPVKTIDAPSNPNDDNHKVKEQKLVVKASESTKVEAKKEDAAVTEKDIAKAKISVATETEKVSTANGAKVAETQEKKP
ncbi:uncharacterized protein LOC110910070 isoform X2 [Helianthus annuus]|uniref:uncharacterized protein LOC110910070 isoform X2 n=1 Tax=Helianthus annuus TaxID=4232 RepID=UPI001652C946|nr:uncharacterized protein LOC110910070 isoform X2 [Helianthus annuus]